MSDYYGYEVQVFGVTTQWTTRKDEADKAFSMSHSPMNTEMFQHFGQVKKRIK